MSMKGEKCVDQHLSVWAIDKIHRCEHDVNLHFCYIWATDHVQDVRSCCSCSTLTLENLHCREKKIDANGVHDNYLFPTSEDETYKDIRLLSNLQEPQLDPFV